ncbi:MAG: polyprenyl diphosphate synthase [Propionibacteriaceae bacterium]
MAISDSLARQFHNIADHIHPLGLAYAAYEQRIINELDRAELPRHVAVMADGNRRWAKLNAPDEPLVTGYRAGAAKLQEFASWCDEVGIPTITLWVLSTENLIGRPTDEIVPLVTVITDLAKSLAATKRWSIKTIGDPSALSEEAQEILATVENETARINGMHINLAINYGGRHELRDSVRSLLAVKAAEGMTLEQIAETLEIDDISDHLYTKGQPDPDLIIRASGEQRLSGLLMWQAAYSEYYFCEALWPDFRRVDFIRALRAYSARERRYGH